jgi:sugar phosphate isomerase/epimerase
VSSYFSRRSLLHRTGSALAGCTLLSLLEPLLRGNPLGMPIGFQGYDARFLLIKDWNAGWKEMRDIGFQSVDLVSFKGYGYEKSSLASMPASEIRKTIESVGIVCENCQFSYAELHDTFDEKMKFSHDLGLKNIICAPASGRTKTIDDWKWQAGQLNDLGKKVKQEGFQLGYHNHDLEFMPIDGVRPYDVLMANTDPALVMFQIDVGNLTFGGADAIEYLKKYTKRYFSMHAKDYRPGKTSVPVGQGSLDWKKIFEVAKDAPFQNYFAEVAAYGVGTLHGVPADAWPADSIEQLRESYIFLHNLKV